MADLPDGVIDLQEGETPQDAIRRFKAEQLRNQAREIVHEGQNSYFPNMATAAGQGVKEMAQKLMRLSGKMAPDSILAHVPDPVKNFASDQAIAETEAKEAELAKQGGGAFGGEVGRNAVAAIPAAGVEGAIGKLGLDASPSIFARTLGKVGQRAAGGATVGLTSAEPGKEFDEMLAGAGVGGAFGVGESAGGRFLKGLAQPSEDLERLRGDVTRANAVPGAPQRDLFVPISQGASETDPVSGFLKRFYKSALPYAPGVETQLNNQSRKAGTVAREIMLQEAAPEITANGQTQQRVVLPGGGPSVQRDVSDLKTDYDTIYNRLRGVQDITVPKQFSSDLTAKIRAADPEIPKSDVDAYVGRISGQLEKFAENNKGKSVSGWNLKNLKDFVRDQNTDLPMSQRVGLTDTTVDHIDNIFANRWNKALRSGNQNDMDALRDYVGNRQNYEAFRPLKNAVDADRANRGANFDFGDVAQKARDFSDLQGTAQDAHAVLGGPATQISQQGRLYGYAATAGANALTGGAYLPATLAIVGGANSLATKAAQKAMYGDTTTQRAVAEFLRKKYGARAADVLGLGLRTNVEQDATDGY